MASSWRVRTPRNVGARYSKNTVGRTRSTEAKAVHLHKPTEVYDFSDNSNVSSMGKLSENEKDEEPYESFAPPLHSTAIDADEGELPVRCSPRLCPAAGRSSNTSETEESEHEFIEISAKKPRRKPKPISDESESCNERDVIIEGKPAEKISSQQHGATSPSELPEKVAELGTPKTVGPLRAKSSVEKETLATESQLKIQKKEKVFHGKRKKSRNEAINSDISDCAHVWCLKGKRSSDIMELDVVLSALEKTIPEYKQNIESKICREAINKFHSTLKEELMRTLIEAQKLKTLKRKNAKMTSDIEKKRQRLIEVQNELLWLEPQLKQLQMKYDELKERKSSLRNAAHFLSNLKQLHQDYSGVRESEPHVKETYDSSSLPALLFKGRTLLGAQSHLQNINYQLERLLERE
ncbi:centromere protein U isoform X2 [Pteronotus mesoamericanus]|uniref:centromere protein U isoform X2 n=1 Tax=Pteronotus mesoamericanus TaxID=1884717 RepID=UPI0023EB7D41|nr:centromere protein U isoform X2 [Pteronotus parnellii mesoamericanus]